MLDINLVDLKDNILNEEAQDFDFQNPPCDPKELSDKMVRFARESGGLGLSAPQIGLPYKVFVLLGNPTIGIPSYAIFNPKIVNYSDEQILLEEGCMSHPFMLVKVKRSIAIRCRFQTHTNHTMTERFTGLTARAFQHEHDHLYGVKCLDRANFLNKKKALKDAKINKRRNKSLV
jgi:peptide deformylase